jgi:hypothetical protein
MLKKGIITIIFLFINIPCWAQLVIISNYNQDAFYSQITEPLEKEFHYSSHIRENAFFNMRIEDIRLKYESLSNNQLIEICTDSTGRYIRGQLSPSTADWIKNDIHTALVTKDAGGQWLAALEELASRKFQGVTDKKKFLLDYISFAKENNYAFQHSDDPLGEGMLIFEAKKYLIDIRLQQEGYSNISTQIPILLKWKLIGERLDATPEDRMYAIGANLLLRDKIMGDPATIRVIFNDIIRQKSNISKVAATVSNKMSIYLMEKHDIIHDIAVVKYRREKGLFVGYNAQNDNFRGP